MSLYQDIRDRVQPRDLTNDVMLLMGGYQTWEKLISNHNMSAQGETDLAAIISYWQGRIDGTPAEPDKEDIRNDFNRRMTNGFLGTDRKQLTEAQFYEILQIDPPGGN